MRSMYLLILMSVSLVCIAGEALAQASQDLTASLSNFDWGVIITAPLNCDLCPGSCGD